MDIQGPDVRVSIKYFCASESTRYTHTQNPTYHSNSTAKVHTVDIAIASLVCLLPLCTTTMTTSWAQKVIRHATRYLGEGKPRLCTCSVGSERSLLTTWIYRTIGTPSINPARCSVLGARRIENVSGGDLCVQVSFVGERFSSAYRCTSWRTLDSFYQPHRPR